MNSSKGKYTAKFKKIKIDASKPELHQDRGALSKEILSHKNDGFITLDTVNDPYLTLYSYETLRNFIKGLSYKTPEKNIVLLFNYDYENCIIPEDHNLEIFEFIKNFQFERKYEEKIHINLDEVVSRAEFKDNSEIDNILGILDDIAPRVKYCEELHLFGIAHEASLIGILEMFKSKPKRIFYQKNIDSENVRIR